MGTPTHHPSGPTRRTRHLPLAAAAVTLLALAATGCGTGASPASTSPPSAGTTAPASVSASATPAPPSATSGPAEPAPSATGSPAAPSARTPAAAGTRCTVTELRMRLGAADHGAGNVYYPLRFTNTGGRTCTLDGFPGVSLIRGDGSVIGRPADRQGPAGTVVRLAPGRTAEADLHSLNEGIKSGGCWRKPTFLKVYPPGSTASMTLATSSPVVCGDTFDVGAVH
ncbi:DUF4232 domain-containing protein [Actinacidiphila acidipaludis]|uniref:DUF4232 domain-containing protein n=1 Tax=Actinacidiphila acidipaludis TaxID=2873382 RepID=A0ABS7Q826_9ACTN|nr:DUF4232 domain-containing protein [Streptomyces acidipaludis]MBY8879324.1 DUF4232 domain-containing protein [Streptomyces acidipaludis]